MKKNSPTVFAIIPARGGSKGVIKKNSKCFGGHPLIAYSIIAAKLCPSIDRVIVSTDSVEITEIAKRYGAEVPFLRPEAYAQDHSPDLDFIKHALDWFDRHEKNESCCATGHCQQIKMLIYRSPMKMRQSRYLDICSRRL